MIFPNPLAALGSMVWATAMEGEGGSGGPPGATTTAMVHPTCAARIWRLADSSTSIEAAQQPPRGGGEGAGAVAGHSNPGMGGGSKESQQNWKIGVEKKRGHAATIIAAPPPYPEGVAAQEHQRPRPRRWPGGRGVCVGMGGSAGRPSKRTRGLSADHLCPPPTSQPGGGVCRTATTNTSPWLSENQKKSPAGWGRGCEHDPLPRRKWGVGVRTPCPRSQFRESPFFTNAFFVTQPRRRGLGGFGVHGSGDPYTISKLTLIL